MIVMGTILRTVSGKFIGELEGGAAEYSKRIFLYTCTHCSRNLENNIGAGYV